MFREGGLDVYKRQLVETARKKEKSQLALILEAICATGVRVSELKYLTVKNLQDGRLEVCNKGKTRIVLIPESLRKKLLCYAEMCIRDRYIIRYNR